MSIAERSGAAPTRYAPRVSVPCATDGGNGRNDRKEESGLGRFLEKKFAKVPCKIPKLSIKIVTLLVKNLGVY